VGEKAKPEGEVVKVETGIRELEDEACQAMETKQSCASAVEANKGQLEASRAEVGQRGRKREGER
jgi:hypothetical protein